jgi:NAD(P)-dependent dehydrogenase (short-subunit alcohol dehydrogenase family)
MSKSVLVTGGSGFIRRRLCRELLENGYDLRVIDSMVEQACLRRQIAVNNMQIGPADAARAHTHKDLAGVWSGIGPRLLDKERPGLQRNHRSHASPASAPPMIIDPARRPLLQGAGPLAGGRGSGSTHATHARESP